MEKRDVIMVVLGLAIVLVVAFVVKPMITGKPVDMSIPVAIPGIATPTSTPHPVVTADDAYERYKASQNMPQVTAVPRQRQLRRLRGAGSHKALGLLIPHGITRHRHRPRSPIPGLHHRRAGRIKSDGHLRHYRGKRPWINPTYFNAIPVLGTPLYGKPL